MRRFVLQTSSSIDAEGVCFSDGTCVVRWRGLRTQTVIWDSIETLSAIHAPGSATQIVWMDD